MSVIPYQIIHTQKISGKTNTTILYLTAPNSQQPILKEYFLFKSQKTNNLYKEIYILPPFKPSNLKITYTQSPILTQAKQLALTQTLDPIHPTATIIIQNQHPISQAANGSTYHQHHPCQRQILKIPSGKGYELCEGCHPNNHSETKAALYKQQSPNDNPATAYLWGHWWCCPWCCQQLHAANINNVYLSASWTKKFLHIDTTFLTS